MTQINWDIKEENINQLYLKELEVLIQELNVPLKELRIELLPYESLLTLSPGATPIKAFKYVLKGKIIGFLTNEGNHLYPEDLENLLITEWLKQVNETGDISGIEKIQDKLVFDNPSITLYPLVPPGEYQYFKAGGIRPQNTEQFAAPIKVRGDWKVLYIPEIYTPNCFYIVITPEPVTLISYKVLWDNQRREAEEQRLFQLMKAKEFEGWTILSITDSVITITNGQEEAIISTHPFLIDYDIPSAYLKINDYLLHPNPSPIEDFEDYP